MERAAEPVRLADFNADGRDDLLLYEAATGRWSLVLDEPEGQRITQGTWLARAQLFPARLDGDHFVDLFLYAPASGEWMQAFGNGDGTFRTVSGGWTGLWELVRLANFIGDARAEVLTYNSFTGDWCLSDSDSEHGIMLRSCGRLPGGDLSVADFNRDSLADLFISDRDGRGSVAINDGSAGFSIDAAQWPDNWPARAANLAGRSAADLVLYDATTGTWAERLAGAGPSAFRHDAWSPGLAVAPVDLNGDGADDLVLYDRRTGLVVHHDQHVVGLVFNRERRLGSQADGRNRRPRRRSLGRGAPLRSPRRDMDPLHHSDDGRPCVRTLGHVGSRVDRGRLSTIDGVRTFSNRLEPSRTFSNPLEP